MQIEIRRGITLRPGTFNAAVFPEKSKKWQLIQSRGQNPTEKILKINICSFTVLKCFCL